MRRRRPLKAAEDADHDEELEELEVEFSLSDDHVSTLAKTAFTVEIKDHHGAHMTDFEEVHFERRLVGSDEWSQTEMELDGDHYRGNYTFGTSGEYEIRVTGHHRGGHDDEVIYERAENLHVERAHMEVGAYRIEFESFPGHMHEEDHSTLTFWVMQEEKDALGEHSAVAGLEAEIHCNEPDGTSESHQAVEQSPGVYSAEHTFVSAGDGHVALHMEGVDGAEIEAEFHFDVAHGH